MLGNLLHFYFSSRYPKNISTGKKKKKERKPASQPWTFSGRRSQDPVSRRQAKQPGRVTRHWGARAPLPFQSSHQKTAPFHRGQQVTYWLKLTHFLPKLRQISGSNEGHQSFAFWDSDFKLVIQKQKTQNIWPSPFPVQEIQMRKRPAPGQKCSLTHLSLIWMEHGRW